MTLTYTKNVLRVYSPQINPIQNVAGEHQVVVVLGFAGNQNHSLYMFQAIIGGDGTMLTKGSKIKMTQMERTIFGDTSADRLNTVAAASELCLAGNTSNPYSNTTRTHRRNRFTWRFRRRYSRKGAMTFGPYRATVRSIPAFSLVLYSISSPHLLPNVSENPR